VPDEEEAPSEEDASQFLHEVSIVAGPIEVCIKGPADDPHKAAFALFEQVWEKVKGSKVFEQDRSPAGGLGFSADLTQDRGYPPYNGEQQWDEGKSGSIAPAP
jgi:hypothetical protein